MRKVETYNMEDKPIVAANETKKTTTSLEEKYLNLIEEYQSKLSREDSRYQFIGYVKLFLVLLFGICIFFANRNNFSLVYILLLTVVLTTLIIFWIHHLKIKAQMDLSKGILSICNKQIQRMNGEWSTFEDIGQEFVDPHHEYAMDLDIVGPKSLFQYLNTTCTWHGRTALAGDLLYSNYEPSQLLKRQKAVQELSNNTNFSNQLQYRLSKIGLDPSTPKLIECLKDKTPFLKSKELRIIVGILPGFTLLFLLASFIFQTPVIYWISFGLVVIQMVLWAAFMVKVNHYLQVLSRLPYKLGAYDDVIELILNREHSTFSSDKLIEIQEQLQDATGEVRALGKIANRVNIKPNPILYFLANILLLWDCQCAFALQKWKEKNALSSEEWFLAIGELESLLSLAQLPNLCAGTCLPTFTKEGRAIQVSQLGHPLLPNESRVCNDFHFKDNIVIISGSNMSGKTTFLRTVGMNMILARAGGFVCAYEMECSLLDVITSMRITDDLNEGVSTFYAELKQVKKVIDSAQENPKMLFLIDEIFRGTNSVDRLLGAKTVIKELATLNSVGLISTHDLELCQLENIKREETHETMGSSGLPTTPRNRGKTVSIKNAHFSEHYENNKIHFNYLLKEGISTTSNARFLMEMVGIYADTEHYAKDDRIEPNEFTEINKKEIEEEVFHP